MRIVGGRWGGRRIAAPPGRATRPTTDRVREAWMNAVAGELPGATVLDLFAGSGALGLEALSRGARHVTFVESAGTVIRTVEKNLALLGASADSFRIVRGDAIRFAESIGGIEFDVAFADPPYGEGLASRLGEIFTHTPFAHLLCIEHDPHEPVESPFVIRDRRYGDTRLTFLSADHDQ